MSSGDFTFLKGNIETIILCSLYKKDKYGYEVAKEIKERTSNKYEIKQPTLYSYFKRLEEDKLIRSYWGETSNGGRRRYYTLTDIGRANCQQFISEWDSQRTVMSDLVDGTADISQITQDEATPLFGRRTQRRSRKDEFRAQLNEQDEISRRLRELSGDIDEETEDEPTPAAQTVATVASAEQVVYEQSSFFDVATVDTTQQPLEAPSTPPQQQQEDVKAKFEVKQDKVEDFMQQFEQRALEAERLTPPAEGTVEENYQHTLMTVLGDQLDGMSKVKDEPVGNLAPLYYEDHPAALEDVADSLAKEGVRIRIYNHATAAYKSKMLIPLSKVLCQTAWLTYAFAALYFSLFALCSISAHSVGALAPWKSFLITLAALVVIPAGFTVYAIVDPTRKDKPKFNFKVAIIVASIICVIIVLFSIALSALGNMEFADYASVATHILIPLGIALMFPVFVVVYWLLYKQY